MAPASDLPAIFESARDTPIGKILGSYAVSAYAATYPDVEAGDYVRPTARRFEREAARRCLGPELVPSLGIAVFPDRVFARTISGGALGARLAENVPAGRSRRRSSSRRGSATR